MNRMTWLQERRMEIHPDVPGPSRRSVLRRGMQQTYRDIGAKLRHRYVEEGLDGLLDRRLCKASTRRVPMDPVERMLQEVYTVKSLPGALNTDCGSHDFIHARGRRRGAAGSIRPRRNRTSSLPGKRMALVLNGDIGSRHDQPEDQLLMCLNVDQAAVPAQRTRIAGIA